MSDEYLSGVEARMVSGEKLDDNHYWSPIVLLERGGIIHYANLAQIGSDGNGTLIGVMENHRVPADDENDTGWCGGHVYFKNVEGSGSEALHELVSKSPLTISPSLGCRSCPSHGFIVEGRWVPA